MPASFSATSNAAFEPLRAFFAAASSAFFEAAAASFWALMAFAELAAFVFGDHVLLGRLSSLHSGLELGNTGGSGGKAFLIACTGALLVGRLEGSVSNVPGDWLADGHARVRSARELQRTSYQESDTTRNKVHALSTNNMR